MNIYAFVLELKAPKSGSVTSRFIDIIKRYAYNPKIEDTFQQNPLKMDPHRWYKADELAVIFKTLRGRVEMQMEADKKNMDKGLSPAEKAQKIKDLARERIADLKEARKLIPDLIGEFRVRLDEVMDKMPALDKTKVTGIDWIEHPGELIPKWQEMVMDDKELQKLQDPSNTETHKLEKKETPKTQAPQKGIGMVEFTKFTDLKNDMDAIQEYVMDLSEKLTEKEIPMPPELAEGGKPAVESPSALKTAGDANLPQLKAPDREVLDKEYSEYLENLKAEHEKLMSKAEDKGEKEKEKKIVEGIEDLKSNPDMKKKIVYLPSRNNPEKITSILIHELEWFKKLHSMYQGVLWVRSFYKHEEMEPEKEPALRKEAAAEYGALDTIHTKLLRLLSAMNKDLRMFSNMDPHKAGTYKYTSLALKACKAFHEEFILYFDMYKEYMQEHKLNRSAMEVEADSVGDVAVVKEFEQIFPKSQAMKELETLKDPSMVKWAEDELTEIHDYFKKEYINPSKKLKEEAEKAKETPQAMIKAMIPNLIKAFVSRWMDVGSDTEEISTKRTDKYDFLQKMLKGLEGKVFPVLADKGVKPVSKGIPSRKELMDYIEREWLIKGPKDILRELFDKSGNPEAQKALKKVRDLGDIHGGGGGSGGGRQKEPKPIVSGMQEITEARLADFLKGSTTPHEYLNDLLKAVGANLHKRVDSSDEILDRGTVASAIVDLMKMLASNMKRVDVSFPVGKSKGGIPYSPAGNLPHQTFKDKKASNLPYEIVSAADERKKDGPRHSGNPPGTGKGRASPHLRYLVQPGPLRLRPSGAHIIVPAGERGFKEALRLKEKLDDLHKLIEKVIAPDKIESVYPSGFIEGFQILQKEEGKGGLYKPTSNPEEEEKARKEDERNLDLKPSEKPDTGFRPIKKDIKIQEKKAIYTGSPTQMTFNVASRFASEGGLEVSTDDMTMLLS